MTSVGQKWGKAKMTYTYDSYHNVKTATTEEGLVYNFAYDAYGNNTAVAQGTVLCVDTEPSFCYNQ